MVEQYGYKFRRISRGSRRGSRKGPTIRLIFRSRFGVNWVRFVQKMQNPFEFIKKWLVADPMSGKFAEEQIYPAEHRPMQGGSPVFLSSLTGFDDTQPETEVERVAMEKMLRFQVQGRLKKCLRKL